MNPSPASGPDIDHVKAILTSRNYEVGRMLGAGGFASVYLIRNQNDNRDFACKVVDRKKLKERMPESVMIAEPETASRFQHPNIIRVIESFKTHTFLFTFMGLCDESIERKIYPDPSKPGKPIELNQAVTWFCQAASAVSYIHSKFYAHRDIKPDNIFISSERVAKLADFGFISKCKDQAGVVLSATQCGTEEYKSPEIYSGPYDAAQADVWALGVTLFEMYTAFVLFQDPNGDRKKWLSNKKKAKLPQWREPIVVRKVVERMLDPNPSTRITSADLIKYINQHLIAIF